ncbi:hypothetical protein [Paenibacillus cremeus]|uniref:Uncharacterized protein n=1 Tax=Paenibacillus cremeus TaxID=2163881 RepID=A0A559KEI5_9BACL|nr:hypothetical protein [Paenibacillus cremeus]TVY10523.1 hypothetical protein FPZ49_07235 [Paenibacillus cremeus]
MDHREVEETLAQLLTEGEVEMPPTAQAVKQKLPFNPEIRIPSQWDPVAEETKLYRALAKEVDSRYDGR